MNSFGKGILAALGGALVIVLLLITFSPTFRGMFNTYETKMQQVDDRTQYKSRKRVEDEARLMIASYQADKIKYEQYKTSDSEEQQGWAEQAKMRANQTAVTYNNFMLKNSFLFKDNIPYDIRYELPILE